MKEKQLRDIKHGKVVVEVLCIADCVGGVSWSQVRSRLGLDSKTIQKTLADLCKFEFITKLEHGYVISAKGKAEIDGQKTTS